MRPETVRELSIERLGWTGPLEKNWQHSYYTYTDFAGFMAQLTPRFPGRPDEYGRIAAECFEDLAVLNVVYAEVSIGAPVREVGDDTRYWPIMEAVEEERRHAEARFPIRLNLITGLMRTAPVEVAVYATKLAIQARERGISIVGIDLHGDEIGHPPGPFLPAYELAGDAGLGLRAHAGEAAGPENVWTVIDLLGVNRIAHGIRALGDPTLIERLEQGDVMLEMCPTSNVRTRIVPDLQEHPIRRAYDLGIPVTVNSDDPLPFFTDVNRECRLLVDEFAFERGDLANVMLAAAKFAYTTDEEKGHLARLIETSYKSQTIGREAV